MRPWFALLALFLLGCPAPFGVRLTVHVPTEVQAKFSAEQPGLVMTDSYAFALLCDPTEQPLTFLTWPEGGHLECEPPQHRTAVYAFRLGPDDLKSLTPLQRMFATCGKSAQIMNGGADYAIGELVTERHLGVSSRVAEAEGDGACDASGNWNVDLTLSLLP